MKGQSNYIALIVISIGIGFIGITLGNNFMIDFADGAKCDYRFGFPFVEIEGKACKWNYNQYRKFSEENQCRSFEECSWLGYKLKEVKN